MTTQRKSETRKFLEKLRGGRLTFGQMIESLCKSDGLTKAELGRRLGVERRQYVSDVTRGKPVSPAMAVKFAIAMEYPPTLFIAKAIEDSLHRENLPYIISAMVAASDSLERKALSTIKAGLKRKVRTIKRSGVARSSRNRDLEEARA